MALTSIERSVCEKLSYDSGGILSPASQAKGIVISQISSIQAALRTYTASPQAIIDAGKASLNTSVDTVLPGDTLSDIQKIITIINNCAYLSGSDALSNPISLGTSTISSIMGEIDGFVDGLIGIPEFGLGKLLSFLDEMFGNILPRSRAITQALLDADLIINCLTNFCDGEFTTEVGILTAQTQALYNDLWIVGDPLSSTYGQLDKATLFSDAELTAGEITKILDVNSEINSVKASAQTSIDSFVNSAKNFKKLGSIVF